jgi:UDP-glucose 4-epimerase
MRVLVTGGAGYIGSHTLVELLAEGHEAFVVDNLSNGHKEALSRVKQIANKDFGFVRGDIRDGRVLDHAFSAFNPEAVIHFAGLKAVGESIEQPLIYYENNVAGSVELLKAMDAHSCKKIVFSSSATVYGTPQYLPLDEGHPVSPANPYGYTKLMVENILKDWARHGRCATALRYFNPVGAHDSGRIGEDPHGIPTNLMPFIAQVAIGRLKALQIFGDDYETRDGTGERDYVHVTDLAKAHLAAFENMNNASGFIAYNIGTGHGTTVKELLHAYGEAAGRKLPSEVVARRSGDTASAFASPEKAKKNLNWSSTLSVNDAILSSWNWQLKNPNGYSQ